MKKQFIFLIVLLISFSSIVNASLFSPKSPPPQVINITNLCYLNNCSMLGPIYMNGYAIYDAILYNTTIVNATAYDEIIVNGTVYADNFIGNLNGENVSDIYVPYLGAIYDVDLGSHILNASELRTQESTGGLIYLERDSSSDVDEGDRLGQISFLGRETDGGLMKVGAYIKAEGDADWNTGLYHPTRLEFFTEDNTAGSGMAYPRLTINSDGQLWITRDYNSLVFGNDKDITEHFDGSDRISSVKNLEDNVDYRFINYTDIIFDGSNVTADYYFGSGAYLSELNVSGDLTGYSLTTSFLIGPTGAGMDLRGDPWWLGGTNLEVQNNITAQYYFGNGSLMTGIIPYDICSSENAILKRNATDWYCSETNYAEGWFGGGGNTYTISISAVNTTYNLTNWTQGETNGFTWSGYGVDVTKEGIYHLSGTVTFVGGNNGDYSFVIEKNYTPQQKCSMGATASTNSKRNVAINCILDLDVGDHLNLGVRDAASPTQNVIIYKTNMNIVEIQ